MLCRTDSCIRFVLSCFDNCAMRQVEQCVCQLWGRRWCSSKCAEVHLSGRAQRSRTHKHAHPPAHENQSTLPETPPPDSEAVSDRVQAGPACVCVRAWKCTFHTCASRGPGWGRKLICRGSREQPIPRHTRRGCRGRRERFAHGAAWLSDAQAVHHVSLWMSIRHACLWVANASNTREAAMSFIWSFKQACCN